MGAAALAMLVVLVRAHLQSITIDEADTYIAFVAGTGAEHWVPASNNHILNSLLMRLTTGIFGDSHLAVRAPAMLGAGVYIAAAYGLSRLASGLLWVQLPLFVCLVFNPFVMDYLVAARGYSLAMAFLLAGIWVVGRAEGNGGSRSKAAALASACAALSVAGNFSFALVNSVWMLVVAGWAWRGERWQGLRSSIGPGLLVTLLLTAPAILRWEKKELWYGAHTLGETLFSVWESTLYQPNPQLANALLLPALKVLGMLLYPLLAAAALAALWRYRSRPAELRAAAVLAGVLVSSIALHWGMHGFLGVLLPKERTALYLYVLEILALGALLRPWRVSPLIVPAVYFLFCLRLDHFREWKWNAETRQLYHVLEHYRAGFGLEDVRSSWYYVSALNFYRRTLADDTFPEVKTARFDTDPSGQIYVLHGLFDAEYFDRHEFEVVYRGRISDVVVLIPKVLAASRCPAGCSYHKR